VYADLNQIRNPHVWLADGDYPWIDGKLYPVDFARYRRLAETIDRGGFFGALDATWPNDPFISASFAASYTTQMRFLVAVYARMTPPKLLSQQALTFDAFTGGRLLLNLISGRDNIMSTYDVTTSHERAAPGMDKGFAGRGASKVRGSSAGAPVVRWNHRMVTSRCLRYRLLGGLLCWRS
jgi:hypothetical protein